MSDETAITTQEAGALATFNYGEQAGKGYENVTTDDMSLSFITILQGLSPQCQNLPGSAQYIPGAAPGMLLDTVLKTLVPGDKGVVFVPVLTQHVFTEWVPRKAGGGFVASHDPTSDLVRKARAASKEFGKYKNGDNDLVETFYMFGMILTESGEIDRPAVIAITSTKIKPYKDIMTALRTCKIKAPLFAHRLRITTVGDQNTKGMFYNFRFAHLNGDIQSSLIPPTDANGQMHPLLLAGQALCEQIAAGRMKMDVDNSGAADSTEPAPF